MSLYLLVIGCVGALLIVPIDRAHADAREEANRHYEAGVIAFEQLRFADAAAEFELAYAQLPAWQVLYNLGAVYAALGRPVQALSAFSRYLEQADESIAPERRQQVKDELAKQRAKTGLLEVRVNAARADIRVDGKSVGVSPLAHPLRLAAGPHLVEIHREGFRSQRRDTEVAPERRTQLEITLTPAMQPSTPVAELTPAQVSADSDNDPGQVHRIVGFSVGGAGLLGIAVGALVTATGQGKHHDAVELANLGRWPDAEALESDANAQKALGFTTMGVGAAFLVAGAAFVLLAPDAQPVASSVRVSRWVSAESTGVFMRRSW